MADDHLLNPPIETMATKAKLMTIIMHTVIGIYIANNEYTETKC
jgi:hypothetical protein